MRGNAPTPLLFAITFHIQYDPVSRNFAGHGIHQEEGNTMSRTDVHIPLPDYRSTIHQAPHQGMSEEEIEESSGTEHTDDAVNLPRQKKHGSKNHKIVKEKKS